MRISSFQGPYRFLSNFYGLGPTDLQVKVTLYRGLYFPTVEHAYVAAKLTNHALRERIRELPSPGEAKRFLGENGLIERPGWEQAKLGVMECLVRQKFTMSIALAEKLLATGDQELVEGNHWGDTFWGVCDNTGEGENNLGKILMQVRAELASI